MVNATLYYKNTPGESPGSIPAGRRIDFESNSTKFLEPMKRNYFNNIKQTPNPQNAGARVINVTENGLKDLNFPLRGTIKVADSDYEKLFDFPVIEQITDDLPFGRFGITYPHASKFSFEPNATKGLSIGTDVLEHNSVNLSVEFNYTMLFGGTFT